MTDLICGVDVSSNWLDACVRGVSGAVDRFVNSAAGAADLLTFCRAHGVELAVMEATGGYERLAFGLLWSWDLPVALVNPRSVPRFAEAMGLLEKTDRIDAGAIAWYAEAKRIVPRPPASAAQRTLTALVTRLRQLTELRTMQSNQRRLVDDPDTLASLDELLAVAGRQIRTFEDRIVALIASDPLWGELDATFRSIKGVAGRTVARLLAEMPEIGTLSGKAVAKLAGLAPIAATAASDRASAPCAAGAAICDPSCSSSPASSPGTSRTSPPSNANSPMPESPKKAIRVALARKLLVRLNAKARDVRREIPIAA